MATQDEQASSKEVKIASDGDVVFLVGPNRKRIQVYSTTMKMASAVFAAMLGPRFSEGQKILARSENEQPIEIKLPDDDPEAFLCICQILHWVGRKANPTSPEILNMAFLADKYDLTRPLSYAVNTWVCEDLQSTDVSTSQVLWELLVASHLFGSSQAFKQVSRKLLMAHVGSFWELAAALPGFGMGYKIAFAHEEARNEVRQRLSEAHTLEMVRQGTDCICESSAQECGYYIAALCDHPELWSHRKPLETVLRIHEDFSIEYGVRPERRCCEDGPFP